MNVKEQLAQAKSELKSLREGVKAQDDQAIARAKELLEDVIPSLEESVEKSAEADQLLAKFGTIDNEPAQEGGEEPKSIGGLAVKSFVGQGLKGSRFSRTSAKASTDLHSTPVLTDIDKKVIWGEQEFTVRDLFATERIAGNSLTYFVGGAMEGAISAVAEGGQKPQVHFPIEQKTVALKKIAGYIKESDEILEDAKWMADAVENRLVYNLKLVEEAQLLAGDGTGANVTGLLNVDGIGAVTYAGELTADDIFKAMTAVKTNSYFNADAIILNPVDYQTFRLAKDANNQYYGGGYFTGAYGNGSTPAMPALWGLKTVTSTVVPAGTAIVGAFKQGASIITKGGISLEATNSDTDDFTNNRVTVRAEERLALACRVPSAFVKVSKG